MGKQFQYIYIYLTDLCSIIFTYMLLVLEAVQAQQANLTAWRHHRRQKRFLIYQNGGVVKVGILY